MKGRGDTSLRASAWSPLRAPTGAFSFGAWPTRSRSASSGGGRRPRRPSFLKAALSDRVHNAPARHLHHSQIELAACNRLDSIASKGSSSVHGPWRHRALAIEVKGPLVSESRCPREGGAARVSVPASGKRISRGLGTTWRWASSWVQSRPRSRPGRARRLRAASGHLARDCYLRCRVWPGGGGTGLRDSAHFEQLITIDAAPRGDPLWRDVSPRHNESSGARPVERA